MQETNKKVTISEDIQDLLKQISLNNAHMMSKYIDSSPLTAHQLYIMKIIRKNPKMNLKALCRELSLSKGAMSIMINKLAEEGYVLRKENAIDRRNVDILLSEKGEKVLDDTLQKSREIFNYLTSQLTEEELIDIRTILKKLSNSIQLAIDNEVQSRLSL